MRRFLIMIVLAAACGGEVDDGVTPANLVTPLDPTTGHLCEQYVPREPDWVEQENGGVSFMFLSVEVANVVAGNDVAVNGVLGNEHCPDGPDDNYYFFENLVVNETVYRRFAAEGYENNINCFVFEPGELKVRDSYVESEHREGGLYFEQRQYVFREGSSLDFAVQVTELHESATHNEVSCGFETLPTVTGTVSLHFTEGCNGLLAVTNEETLTVELSGEITEDLWDCRTVAFDGVSTTSAHTPILLPPDPNAEPRPLIVCASINFCE